MKPGLLWRIAVFCWNLSWLSILICYCSSSMFINIIHSIINLHQSWCSLYDKWSTKNNETELTMESCTLHTLHSACYCCLSSFITIIHLQSSISIKIEAHSGVKRRVSTAEGMSRGRDRAFGAFLAADHLGTPNSFKTCHFSLGNQWCWMVLGYPNFIQFREAPSSWFFGSF